MLPMLLSRLAGESHNHQEEELQLHQLVLNHQEEELHLRQFLQEEEEAVVHHHPVDTEDHHPLVAVAEEDHLLHPRQLIRATVTPRPLPCSQT